MKTVTSETMSKVFNITVPWNRYKVEALTYLKGDYMSEKAYKGYLIATLITWASFLFDIIRGGLHIIRNVRDFGTLEGLQLVNSYLDVSLGIALIVSSMLVLILTLSMLVNPYFKKLLLLWFVTDIIVSIVAKDYTTTFCSAVMISCLLTYPDFERMNYQEKQLYNQTMKFYRHNKNKS